MTKNQPKINVPVFVQQTIKSQLTEWGIPAKQLNILIDNYNSEAGLSCLSKLESCLNAGMSINEALGEAHRAEPSLLLYAEHKDIEHWMYHMIMKNTPTAHRKAIGGLWYLAHTAINGLFPDTLWIDPPLAGKNISLFILNNFNIIQTYIGRDSDELKWLESRQFYQCKFNMIINDLPPNLESQLPDPFIFYKALETCFATDDFYLHDSVLPDILKPDVSKYYNVLFT